MLLNKYYCIIIIMTLASGSAQAQGWIRYVQPMAGTAPSTTYSAIKHSESGGTEVNANTIPAVGLPFAMTQWTPQTRTSEVKCLPPYYYKDTLMSGFRGTHWLSGSCTQDYGSVTIMPVLGKLRIVPEAYSIPFSHNNEIATPAFYQLSTKKLISKITSSARCGMLEFTVLQDDSLYLLILPNSDEAKGFVKVDASKNEVWGYNPVHRIYQGWGEPAGFSGWFYVKINRKSGNTGTFSGNKVSAVDSIFNQKDIGAYLGFSVKKGETIQVQVGTSFSSLNGARLNWQKELSGKGFNEVLASANNSWEKALGQIKISSAQEKDKRIFYTAMYHAMQHPRLFSDVDGTYPKFAGGGLTKMKEGHYYDDFSMWDIYRAQLPLIELLQPKFTNALVRSLILKGQQGGWLPIFPCWNSYTAAMIGDHVTAFIASAYNRGIRNYDVEAAYALMRKNAFESPADFAAYANGMGRRALTSYLKYGYIPMEDSVQQAFHKKEQVSRTLEYAFDDYALSLVAKGLGKKMDYEKLHERALNYRHVFDSSTGMVRGRSYTGNWYFPFVADKRAPYITEGTPRQYTFYVPHDIPGLVTLMGGAAKFENALDSLFIRQEYWHGNEPGHQIPFLYNYTSSPSKTQQYVYNILKEEYSDGPGGLSGNDDAGQMSAWYVFAAMGFYPVDPVSGEYLLTAPLFNQISLQLADNKKFTIICHRNSDKDLFIQKIKLNGKSYTKNYLTHQQILNGGLLDIWLSNQPGNWGKKISAQPGGLSSVK